MSKPKFYQGAPDDRPRRGWPRPRGPGFVTVDGKPLDVRNDLRNHSPDGFNWGYGGSGPAQLALAILAEEFDDQFAMANYQGFKRDVVARLDQGKAWDMTSRMIRDWASEFAQVPT